MDQHQFKEPRDPLATPEQKLAWQDYQRAAWEQAVALLQDTRAALADRDDHPAAWAKERITTTLEAIAAELAKPRSVEPERAAYRAAVDAARACAAAVADAADTDTLLRAQAEQTLANRRAGEALEAFAIAVDAARLPGIETVIPHLARPQYASAQATGTADLRQVAPDIVRWDFGYANRAADLAHVLGRDGNPDSMVFDIVLEGEREPTEAERLCFAIRWQAFAQRHHQPFEEIDLAAEIAAIAG